MEVEKLMEEKSRLENELKQMCQKTESDKKLEIVKLLHDYNNVKDAVQTLIGALANIENVTSKEIHERLNLHDGD